MHTPGPWITCGFENLTVNDSAGNTIVACPGSSTGTRIEMKANARLIAEAGTVAHETGLTPRQLADLNKELLEALKDLYYFADGLKQEWEANNPNGVYNPLRIKHLMAAKQAIAKAEGRD